MDDKDLFSYSPEPDEQKEPVALDLNSFSSGAVDNERKKKNERRRSKERFLKTFLTVMLIGIITVSIVVGTFIVYVFTVVDGTMDEDLDDLKLNFTTTIYVQNEKTEVWEEYQRLHGIFNRIWVPYDRNAAEALSPDYTGIPQNLINAFVAVEDKRFFKHDGVDWKRTTGSFINMFIPIYSSAHGGSTITQQLVKNLTGDASRKPSRKMREIMRARYLEGHYSKDTIIECYLNTIAMGHGTYGVEVAANYYFDKSVHELTLLECASLAAITKSPSNYAPDDEPENNKNRRETVLALMLAQKLITQEEHDAALQEEFKLVASKEALNENEVNNYFVDALIAQVTKDIAEKYGYDLTHAANNFYSGGYKIYATVDPEIQATVDKVFSDSKKYGLKGKDGQLLQGAITVADYEGHVLALAGGIGQKTVNLGLSGFNRATDAIRQPGSTMKPIAAYAPAIEKGVINYSSRVNDVATSYNGWTPVNWYKGYWGNISVEYALERSVNSIPVYLVNKIGPQVSYDFLTKKLGITTLTSEDVNLSPLGMGGTNGGITTFESAAAYAVFGNGGFYYEPTLYYAVYDQKGDEILSPKSEPVVAISDDTATVMNKLLQSVVYGGNGTGRNAAGYIPEMKIYAKTGTSNNANDLWFVGGSPYYVASCWCGYDTQQAISDSAIALKMWGAVMSEAHKGLTPKEFEISSFAADRYYCTSTGLLATENCPSKGVGWYRKNDSPSVCTEHAGTALDAPSVIEEKNKEENKEETSSSTESATSDTQSATE